jgi:hypothetical protein
MLKDKFTFLYCPKAEVYHSHPFSVAALSKRAFRDGRAFRMIKNKYDIDLVGRAAPTIRSRISILSDEIKTYGRFFWNEGYVKYLFLLPAARLAVYSAYWKGYKSIL